jgi:hypothetical protein
MYAHGVGIAAVAAISFDQPLMALPTTPHVIKI